MLSILVTILCGSIVEVDATTDVITSDTTITSLTVESGDILLINPGVTLTIKSNMENFGIIVNQGHIENNGILKNNNVISNDRGANIVNNV